MKRVIIACVLLASVASTPAAVVRWSGAGTADYTDVNSWTGGSVPTAADSHALIGGAVPQMPVVSSAVPSVPPTLGISWDNPTGQLTIVSGGQINASNVYVGYTGVNPSHGTLIMTGGYMTASQLFMGYGTGGIGDIHLTGDSLLHLAIITYQAGHVNLGDNARLLINGNLTGLNLIGSIIFPIGSGSNIIEAYDAANNWTEFSVIPGYHTGTIAHWNFEEGTDGLEHAGDQDNFYRDISGYGNHLSSWWDKARPKATSDCPFDHVVTGVNNSMALEFDRGGDNLTPGVQDAAPDDLGTHAAQTGPKMLETYLFNGGWTIECSFKAHQVTWEILVGKDGHPIAGDGASPFWFKLREDNAHLDVLVVDDSLNIHGITSINPIDTEKWYSVAATYDNAVMKLYLKGEGDADYVLQGSLNFSGGAKLGTYPGVWTVGRGQWFGGTADWFNGLIDEVRISDIALAPEKFLNSDEVDADADGIPDEWEVQNFGSTVACVAEEDSEPDGVNNGDEYALGGNPNIDDAAAISLTQQFIDPGSWEQVYNRRIDISDDYLNYEIVWKVDLMDAWSPSTKDQWIVGISPYGTDAERVTINIPVGAYGLSQAFTQIQVTKDWRDTLFTQAKNPSPADDDYSAIDDGLLSWDAAAGATSYDVYFSTNQALVDAKDTNVLVSTQAGTSYDASALTSTYTTYHWRVAPVAADPSVGFMPSQTWSFKQTIPASLGRGHRLMVKRGLLHGAMVFAGDYGFDWGADGGGSNVTWATWNDLKGNLVDCHGARFNYLTGWATPPNINYSRWCWELDDLLNGTGICMLDPGEIFYIGGIDNLATLQATDEQDLSVGSTVTAIKAAFDRWKAAYPNTMVHANIIGTESRFYDGYEAFQRTAKPDLAFMDAYEFNGNGGTLDKHYYALSTMRDFGKIGIGATQYSEPIPCGMWYQCMSMFGRQQTQPEVCLAMYSPIAYGYTVLKGWVYSYNANIQSTYADVLFSSDNDSARTVYFDMVAENNRQIELMGDSLVRLSHEGSWDVNDESGIIPPWNSSVIPEITAISAADDVVISKFVPLHEDFDGSIYNNETYFFLLNGNAPWADTSKTPANTAQTITLTMGGGITNLEAIDLSTGAGAGTVETIPVTGGTVDITLDGGRGKLFKFQTGAPWVGFYNGE